LPWDISETGVEKEAARIAMGKGICAPGRLHGGAGPLVPQCAVILTVSCYESRGHCPELRQSGGEGSNILGGPPQRRLYEREQTCLRCEVSALDTVNSMGKEAILRAWQAEMFAQRHPFVVAAKQAAML